VYDNEKILITALGGALKSRDSKESGIGGSSYVLEFKNYAIVVDAGQFLPSPEERLRETKKIIQKEKPQEFLGIGGEKYPLLTPGEKIIPGRGREVEGSEFLVSSQTPDWSRLKNFSQRNVMVVITHGHLEHVMGLPKLLRDFPEIKIVMTKATFQIFEWLLKDSRRLQKDGFVDIDVDVLKEKISFIEEDSRFDFGPFNCRTFSAGHILGSVSILVEIENRKKIVFTGDISMRDQRLLKKTTLLDEELKVDALITETTNAYKRGPNDRLAVEQALCESIIRTLDKKGRYVMTSPAIGRAQEIWAILEARGITKRYSVYMVGGAAKIGYVYAKKGLLEEPEKVLSEDLLRTKKPFVVIAPSGMLNGGMSLALAKKFIDDPHSAIGFSCWQDPYSPGSAVLSLQEGDRIFFGDKIKKVKAQRFHFSLSTHPNGDEIMSLINHLRPEKVFMVHGEPAAMEAFSKLNGKAEPMLIGTTYEI
jgi:putative mRNA 3-end processing factor